MPHHVSRRRFWCGMNLHWIIMVMLPFRNYEQVGEDKIRCFRIFDELKSIAAYVLRNVRRIDDD